MEAIKKLCDLFAGVADPDTPIGKAGGRINPPEPPSNDVQSDAPISGTHNSDGKRMNAEDIEQTLRNFSGSTEFFKWSYLFQKCVLTEGAQFLAEAAQCYWLMDLIASAQCTRKVRVESFQVWHIRVYENVEPPPKPWLGPDGAEIEECSSRYAYVWANDGRGSEDHDAKLLYCQFVPYTDFPLGVVDKPYTAPCNGGNPSPPSGSSFKLFAAQNELGGITILLPSEH